MGEGKRKSSAGTRRKKEKRATGREACRAAGHPGYNPQTGMCETCGTPARSK